MVAKYQNKEVTVVRPAKEGDTGFDKAKGEQSLIRMPDGSQKAVPATEVSDTSKPE